MSKKTKNLTKEFLLKHYLENKESCSKIGKILNCSPTAVYNALKKFGIDTKTRKDYSIDLSNKKFSKFFVLRKIGFKKGETIWECRCDCGNLFNSPTSQVISLRRKSCGCQRERNRNKNSKLWGGFGEISGYHFSSIKKRARKINCDFDIDIQYIWDLYLKQDKKCALSGIEIKFAEYTSDAKNKTASLDRKDNSKGYVKGNVQWVHKKINFMKHNMEESEFIEFCLNVAKFQKENGFHLSVNVQADKPSL